MFFAQEVMNVSNSYLGYVNTFTAFISLFLYPVFGKLSHRFGNRQILSFGIICCVLNPVVYIFMAPETAQYLLVLDGLLVALSFTAVNLAFFNLLLETVKEPTESYLAVYAFLVGLSAILAGCLGGSLGDYLKTITFTFSGMTFYGLQWIFLAAFFLRLICFLLLAKATSFEKPIIYARPILTFLGVFRAREILLGFYDKVSGKTEDGQ